MDPMLIGANNARWNRLNIKYLGVLAKKDDKSGVEDVSPLEK